MNSTENEGFKIEYMGEHSHGPVYEADLETGEIRYKGEEIGMLGNPISEVVEEDSPAKTVESDKTEAVEEAYEALLDSGIDSGQSYTRSIGGVGSIRKGVQVQMLDGTENELEIIDDMDEEGIDEAVEILGEALEV